MSPSSLHKGNHMQRIARQGLIAVTALGLVTLPVISASAAAKVGQKCTKVGEVKDGLVCTAAKGRRTYQKPAAVAATTIAVTTPGATTTPAPTGLAKARGFDGTTFQVGYLGQNSTSPAFAASGFFVEGGKALTAAYNAYIAKVNDKGGIAGKYKIKVNFKETYYDAGEASKAFAEVKDSSVMIGQIYGTPATKALKDKLAAEKIIASPVSLDYEWINNPWVLPVGSTYQAQAINLLDWYSKEGGGAGKKVCSVALNSEYGLSGEEGYDYAAKKVPGLTYGIKIRMSTTAAVMSQFKTEKCDAILATVSGELHTPGMLTEGAKIDYFPTILGLSPSFSSKVVNSSNSAAFGKQVTIAADGSQWGDPSIPGQVEMLSDLKKYAPEQLGNPNPANVWGWVQARTDVALLEKAVALGDVSPEGMQKAMFQLGTVSSGGAYEDWTYTDAAKRLPPSSSNIYKVDISVKAGLSLIKNYNSQAAKDYRR
jgi:Periplasmic binding protein